MSTRELHHSLALLEQAMARLRLALDAAQDGDELKQDGAIQRFEFTFELLWKTLKIYLRFLGQPTNNPRDTLKGAFRQGLLADETVFLTMLDDRNLSAHVYDFETTRVIFSKLAQAYFPAMTHVIATLRTRLAQPSS